MSDLPAVTHKIPLGPEVKVKVIFRGFIITEIRADSATIGALDPSKSGAPCHKPIVHVFKITPPDKSGGEESIEITNSLGFKIDVTKNFSLLVPGPSNIQVFQKDTHPSFNRLDEDNDKKDFRWFVDLNEIHGRKPPNPPVNAVKVQKPLLIPKFVLNNGVFHSSKLSDGEVTIQLEKSTDKQRFGRFSLEITARIVLAPKDVAVFSNEQIPFTIRGDDNFRYEIVFDCTCRSVYENTSDFHHIYDVVTNKDDNPIDPGERVKLESRVPALLTEEQANAATTEGESVSIVRTPEVYCTGGNG